MIDFNELQKVSTQFLLYNCYKTCEHFALFPLVLTRHDAQVTIGDFNFSKQTMLHRLNLFRANLLRALGGNAQLTNEEKENACFYVTQINFIINF